MTRAALILTHNRPELLADCVTHIGSQVDTVLIIDNASDPPVQAAALPEVSAQTVWVLHVPDQPPNLSRLWNIGLEKLRSAGDPRWVAFLCDDTAPPAGWMDAVIAGMEQTGAVAGCSNPDGHQHPPQLKTAPDSDLRGRMVGWAFVLDTTRGVQADERLHFWWADTAIDWAARAAGGSVMVGGYPVPNRLPNDHLVNTPGMGEQAGRDGEVWAANYGSRPW